MNSPIRVILADDHPIVRRGIRLLLNHAEDIQVVGEAATGKDALRLTEETPADILILDMQFPDMRGIEVARLIQNSGNPIKILVLSAYNDRVYVQEIMEAGAVGYLLKDEAPQLIIEALRGIAHGDQGWVSRGIAAQMISWVRDSEDGEIHFTPRELDVLRLLVSGNTNQQIAADLHISEKTAEKHLNAIFQKLGVTSRTEAAVFAVRAGIV